MWALTDVLLFLTTTQGAYCIISSYYWIDTATKKSRLGKLIGIYAEKQYK